jgi:hypothetical protein
MSPEQARRFKVDHLTDIGHWKSREENWLAVARGRITEDVVMITESN